MSTSTQQLTGANLIAGQERPGEGASFRAVDPRTGKQGDVEFREASGTQIAEAAAAAAEAFEITRNYPSARIAQLLRAVADRIEGLGDQLLDVADWETALGHTRLTGERARTCNQLRAFADVVEEGSYLDVIIDPADPQSTPPRPDLRRMQIPIGPVAVFGASNFPLAFSVPGGDTAAAFAAGCPVVVKAHPSHPGTSELCGRAIVAAVRDVDAPAGMFSLVHGTSADVGGAVVTAPQIKAVGFTGSQRAGRALYDLAADRDEPIPVYAEMGSLNPTFVTAAALASRGEEIADGFVGSMTMGTGQFCTKPGLVFVSDDAGGKAFADAVAERISSLEAAPLLNERIREGLGEQLAKTTAVKGVETLAGGIDTGGDGFTCAPTALATDLETFLESPELSEEHFGPVSIVVRCSSDKDLVTAAAHLHGHLTATIHGEESDFDHVGDLQSVLREKAGRVLWNGYPTGVSVTHAMHHGGPYPATTNAAHTSVGSTAIRRFLRPVTYQNTPQALLPPALRDDNPLGIRRLVDGEWTDAPL